MDADASTVSEGRRVRSAHPLVDPLLAPYAKELRAHFGNAAARPLDVQIVHVGDDRVALLVRRAAGDAQPLVLLVDASHRVLWKKEHPAGGIVTPVGDLAIASGPSGRVVLAACDPPTHAVALRQWNDDATPFADFQPLEVETCDAVSLLRWPRHGWIVVAWRAGSARAQLLSEHGTLRWGSGLDLGVPTRSGAPGALALDTPDSFVLVERAPLPGGQTAYAVEHVLALRYDRSGSALWRAPVDLGVAPTPPAHPPPPPPPPRPWLEPAASTSPKSPELEISLGGSKKVGITSGGETRGSF